MAMPTWSRPAADCFPHTPGVAYFVDRAVWEENRMTTIYVGNLPFNATEQDLRALFESHGAVESKAHQ